MVIITLRILIVFLASIAPLLASEELFLSTTVERATLTLRALENHSAYPNCPLVSEEAINCQKVLKAIDADAASNAFGGILKSRYPICEKYLGHAPDTLTPWELAQTLKRDIYPQASSQMLELIKTCADTGNFKESKKLASSYFYISGLIDEGAQSSLGVLAEIDSLLGKSGEGLLKNLDCQNSLSEEYVKQCQSLKNNCEVKSQLLKVAKETDEAIKNISRAEKLIKSLESQEKSPETVSRIAQIRAGIAITESQYPWIKGEIFKRVKNRRRDGGTQKAIRAELSKIKEATERKVRTFSDAMKCMKGVSDLKRCPDLVKEALIEAPNLKQLAVNYRDKKNVIANNYLSFHACSMEGMLDRDQVSSVLSEAAWGAGLTVATLGAGALFSGARAINSARMIKAAEMTQKGVQVANVADTSVSVKAAIEACAQKSKVDIDSMKTGGSCPMDSEVNAKLREESSCVAQLLLTSVGVFNIKSLSTIGKSGTPTIDLKTAGKLGDKERISEAQILLKSKNPLNEAQQKAILDAHHVAPDKGYFEYSFSELREKMRILKEAGFSRSEADTLMRHGITGNPAPIKQDPLSLKYIDRNSDAFINEMKRQRSGDKIKDRLTGEEFTKREVIEQQRKALERPMQFGEDPYTGIPIDQKRPLYKVNQEIKTANYWKWQTGKKLEPWEWLVHAPDKRNVNESITHLMAVHMDKALDAKTSMTTLSEIGKHHKTPPKEVFEQAFKTVRGKMKELESEAHTPRGKEYLERLKTMDENIQRVLRRAYDQGN